MSIAHDIQEKIAVNGVSSNDSTLCIIISNYIQTCNILLHNHRCLQPYNNEQSQISLSPANAKSLSWICILCWCLKLTRLTAGTVSWGSRFHCWMHHTEKAHAVRICFTIALPSYLKPRQTKVHFPTVRSRVCVQWLLQIIVLVICKRLANRQKVTLNIH